MCSVSLNETASEALNRLSRQGSNKQRMIERRLIQLAGEASTEQCGALDGTDCHFKPAPRDLAHVRKHRIGRHRVYYTGSHTQCMYHLAWVKEFKRTGVDDEDDRVFQKKLASALQKPARYRLGDGAELLPLEDEPDATSQRQG